MEYSSHYGSEEEYRKWVDAQHELAQKYEQEMLEVMGVPGESVADALVGCLPDDVTNTLLEGVGLGVFVYDEEEVKNHGKVIYADQNLTITEQFYTPQKDPVDNLIQDFIVEAFAEQKDEVTELSPRAGEMIVEVLPTEKEPEPQIEGTIYNVWVRVDVDEEDLKKRLHD